MNNGCKMKSEREESFMRLEIVTTTLDETLQAAEAGADRVELVSGITEGALTPTYGSIKGVHDHSPIPAFCMIRPHNQGFVYSKNDVEEMIDDIRNQQGLADHFVLGCLTEENQIDEEALKKLVDACGTTPVVFHKAFDRLEDQKAALHTLAKYPQIKRVLSNFKAKNIAEEIDRVKEMLDYATSLGIKVTFAGGINADSIRVLKSIGAEDVHISSAARIDGLAKNKLDLDRIREFHKLCNM